MTVNIWCLEIRVETPRISCKAQKKSESKIKEPKYFEIQNLIDQDLVASIIYLFVSKVTVSKAKSLYFQKNNHIYRKIISTVARIFGVLFQKCQYKLRKPLAYKRFTAYISILQLVCWFWISLVECRMISFQCYLMSETI